MGQVQGKVALVTGAASGIGAACAETLAREGARVVLTDLDDPRGEAVAARIRERGGEALYLHQDVTEEARWAEVVAETERRFGGLHILVSNAGIGIIGMTVEMSLADWRRQMAVNVDGVFLSVKHAIPAMRRSGGGSVILMSSVAGLRGSAGLAGYSATKGAVRLFAKSVALECAMARDGIRVNSVHPGVIETPIWEKLPAGQGGGRNAPIDARALAAAGVPLGVPGQAQDIADGVLFLASDASRHMTGAELVIDGGMTAGRVGNLAAVRQA
ncbi:SDR family NAD(P)-dependent oxidoreductase [Crenalkalicoccus roseus]|uniref:SDR family NAD(P)-dependent oxidoreductase n=1 Tax=Crenalkalicoccus roseus TaxID=1485588 RepID=UPI001080762E|nr:glucose 1-dehydrogenase [Crenalkalicoccus roseus]